MPKYATKILYYNNGVVLSESVLTIPLQDINQEKTDTAMRLMLRIHKQSGPFKAYTQVKQGKKVLKEFKYPYQFESDRFDNSFESDIGNF
ncbi:MAG: hypothetical protein V4506_14445 [Bacteroidota bacterium]